MIKALKYALASSILLISTTQTYAKDECSIDFTTNQSLIRTIKEKGFVFENYDKVCKLLRSANASVDIVSMSQISPYQTTAAVDVRLKAKEYEAQGINVYSEHQSWIRYEQERTTLIQESAAYNVTMSALNAISQNSVDELNKQRAALKNYKAKK